MRNFDSISNLIKESVSNNQTTTYEYTDDDVCIRTQPKQNDDNESCLLITVRIFNEYKDLKGFDSVSSRSYPGSGSVKNKLNLLENEISVRLNVPKNTVNFENKEVIDGGSVKYRYLTQQ